MNDSTKQLHQQADQFLDNNNLASAYATYQKICQLDTQDAEAFMMIGALDGEMGKMNDAMRSLQQAIQIDPEYADAFNTLAHLYQHQGEFKSALENAKKAAHYDPDFFEAWSLLASLNGQLKNYKDAEEAANKALTLNPDHNETRLILANAKMELEKYEEAILEFKVLIQNNSGNAHIYSRIGGALARLNRFEEAIQMLQLALNMNPSDTEVRSTLGHLYSESDEFEAASEQYQNLIEAHPEQPKYWANFATLCKKFNNWNAYSDFCEQQVIRTPDNQHALLNQAYAQEQLEEFAKARELYFKVSESYPDWGEAWNRLGMLHSATENFILTRKFLKKAIELGVNSPLTFATYGATLRTAGYYDQSEKYCQMAIELAPNLPVAYIETGSVQIRAGKLDEALETLNKGLTVDPENLNIIAGISDIYERKGQFEEAEKLLEPHMSSDHLPPGLISMYAKVSDKLKRGEQALSYIDTALNNDKLLPFLSKELHFRAADIHHTLKDFDKAFSHYEKANALENASFDSNENIKTNDNLIRSFNKDTLKKLKLLGNPTASPVFIVGMPRSGTSLAEQILASHSDVYGAGELMDLPWVVEKIGGVFDSSNKLEEFLSVLSHEKVNAATSTYLHNINSKANGESMTTDKMPYNYRYLGIIQILFPNAKIIHTKRNAMDTCLSCYCLDFTGDHPQTYDLYDLGDYYSEYERLMSHWKEVLDLPILDVQYEEVVDDMEANARKIIAHCGLEWSDDVLNFHKTDRVVKTASYDQVRKPIYKTSVERWRAYEEWLDPLKKGLKRKSNAN